MQRCLCDVLLRVGSEAFMSSYPMLSECHSGPRGRKTRKTEDVATCLITYVHCSNIRLRVPRKDSLCFLGLSRERERKKKGEAHSDVSP